MFTPAESQEDITVISQDSEDNEEVNNIPDMKDSDDQTDNQVNILIFEPKKLKWLSTEWIKDNKMSGTSLIFFIFTTFKLFSLFSFCWFHKWKRNV